MTDAGAASREGEVLAGKYKLEKRLGGGGMGEVYRAQNMGIGRIVAIKVLRAEHAENGEIVSRFVREAQAAIIVKHPHVVDILDVDTDANGTPFIVQEFLEGEDLGAHIESMGGRISAEAAIDLLMPVIEAVALAHARGVIHRDLKPENVFLARDGNKIVPKLLDFGISQIKTGDVRITSTGIAMGTPAYMSPEQIKGAKEVDARTDVWALGIILYEVLAGDYPFKAETQPALFVAIATAEIPALTELAPHISPTLCRIVHRCLRRNPDERYPSATELARDLNKFLDGEEIEPTLRRSIPPLKALLKQLDADQLRQRALGHAHTQHAGASAPADPLEETAHGPDAATVAPPRLPVIKIPGYDATPVGAKVAAAAAPAPKPRKDVPELDLPPPKPASSAKVPVAPPAPPAPAPRPPARVIPAAGPPVVPPAPAASPPSDSRQRPASGLALATLPPRRGSAERSGAPSGDPATDEARLDPGFVTAIAVLGVSTLVAVVVLRAVSHQFFVLRELPVFDGKSPSASGVGALAAIAGGALAEWRAWKMYNSELPGCKTRGILIACIAALAFLLASELVGASIGG